MRRGYSFIRGQAFVGGSLSHTIMAGDDAFAEKMYHTRGGKARWKTAHAVTSPSLGAGETISGVMLSQCNFSAHVASKEARK